ncbi:MAG TPA: NAD(P)-dependent oxidoreductase [Actinomycetota bacterium]|nr:NAD(P)-dependent oxidoreductase [Actinomycetota bacterium]
MAGGSRVAVVGAGRMGAAMVGTLCRAGVEVVVFNRTRAKAEAVGEATGAAVATTAREAAASAQVVLSSLADDAAVGAAYTGGDGIVAGLQPGAVVCEASTIDPGTVRRLRPLVEDRGASLLDTPVSGSVSTVEAGQLTIMAGGDPDVLDRVRPVLDPLAKQVFHVGELGSGAVMKLTVNSVLHGLNLALAEGLVLAERAGVERSAAYEVFAASVIAAPFVHYKREAFEHPGQPPVAFSLDLVAKDLDLILALAAEAGATMEQATTNHRVVEAAVAAGLGDHDLSELTTYLRRTPDRA